MQLLCALITGRPRPTVSDGVDAPPASDVPRLRCRIATKEASVDEISIIGVDIAKHVFQLHGANADGSIAFSKKVSRSKLISFLASQPRCMVAMEASADSHHWGRMT